MVESTSQKQTLTSGQVQEESECGELAQDVCLEQWDLTPGLSTDLAIVDVKSPDTSHTEGQSDPEEEESIQEPFVCAIAQSSASHLFKKGGTNGSDIKPSLFCGLNSQDNREFVVSTLWIDM
ncbi:uncharacterized protein LOC143998365 [Lithobates pipiens]